MRSFRDDFLPSPERFDDDLVPDDGDHDGRADVHDDLHGSLACDDVSAPDGQDGDSERVERYVLRRELLGEPGGEPSLLGESDESADDECSEEHPLMSLKGFEERCEVHELRSTFSACGGRCLYRGNLFLDDCRDGVPVSEEPSERDSTASSKRTTDVDSELDLVTSRLRRLLRRLSFRFLPREQFFGSALPLTLVGQLRLESVPLFLETVKLLVGHDGMTPGIGGRRTDAQGFDGPLAHGRNEDLTGVGSL